MATRATKQMPTAEGDETPDDGVPSFTTPTEQAVKYDGPVLFRADGHEYRMRTDRSFAASLRYLRLVRKGAVRDAELALIDHAAGPEATDKLIQTAELDAAAWIRVVRRAADWAFGRELEDEGGN